MTQKEMDRILKQIAKENHTTPEEVRREMELALETGMASRDPLVRARWERIPRKGEKVTLEEFLDYTAGLLNRMC